MNDALTVTRPFRARRGAHGRRELRQGEAAPPVPAGRVPRVSRLMALAIRFDQLLRDGVVKDQAELARLGHVSRARLTQVMNLLSLAPDIQEKVLFLPLTVQGPDVITEKRLRPVASHLNWRRQRQAWISLEREIQSQLGLVDSRASATITRSLTASHIGPL